MKKILLLCVLLFPLFVYGESIQLDKPVLCFKPTEFFEAMKQTKEVPIFVEDNTMTNKTTITLFKYEKTGDWTLIEFNKEMICLLAIGKTGQKL